jgi:hypothetical protein
MKARLTFDLSNPEDLQAHKIAIHSQDMAYLIWNLKVNILRRIRKDGLNVEEALEMIQDELNDLPFDIEDLVR